MDRRRVAALARLAAQFATHQVRRATRRPSGGGLEGFVDLYREDGLVGMPPAARRRFEQLLPCVSCGLCGFALAPRGDADPQRLVAALTRSQPDFAHALADASELRRRDLERAQAMCPYGIPFTAALDYLQETTELMQAEPG